jgi:hypothetical protein
MTPVPGDELGRVYKTLSKEDRDSILQELKGYLEAMRRLKSPWGENRICSLIGTAVRSVRIANHRAGPYESEPEFNEYLLSPAWAGGFQSEAEYTQAFARAKKMEEMSHRIVFTHGDLAHHNIMVKGGRITGFLDWEASGWYPDYWEFTTPLKFGSPDFWWYGFIMELGGESYLAELDCERALMSLTIDSYCW